MDDLTNGDVFWKTTSGKSFFEEKKQITTPPSRYSNRKNPKSSPLSTRSFGRSSHEFAFSTPNNAESFEFPSGDSSNTPSFFDNISGASPSFLNVSSTGSRNLFGESILQDVSASSNGVPVTSQSNVVTKPSPVFTPGPLADGNGGARLRTTNNVVRQQSNTSPANINASTTINSDLFTFSMTDNKPNTRKVNTARRRNPYVTDAKNANQSLNVLNNTDKQLMDSFTKLDISNKAKELIPVDEDERNLMKLNDGLAQLKILLKDLNGIKPLNDMRTVGMMIESLEKTVQSVRDTFTCEICHFPQYNFFYFCPECGRLAGCFICSYQIDRCPTCRKRLPLRKNRKPNMIPGLADALGENLMSREDLKKQLEKIDTS